MALSANTIWEVRPTGSGAADTNGGGFVSGASGTDFSQQDAPQFTGTDLASTNGTIAAPAVTSVSHSFVSADVGNIIQISAGTSWTTGFYQIVSVSAGAATLDRACGSAATLTGGTWAEGGALASPGMAGAARVSGNTIWIKTGTYLITSATSNVSGGCYSSSNTTTIEGYATSRGDLGTSPILKAGGISAATLVKTTSGNQLIRNLIADGQSITSIRGFDFDAGGNPGFYYLLTAKNCTNSGMVSNRGAFMRSVATGCSVTGAGISGNAFLCEAYSNTVTGIKGNSAGSECTHAYCLSYNNAGASSDGFVAEAYQMILNCTAYNNGRHGFSVAANSYAKCVNCLAEVNTGAGFNVDGTTSLVGCGAYLNTGGAVNATPLLNQGFVTNTTGSFFVNAAGGNFALNNTPFQGALARGAGYPGAFISAATTGYPDIGSVQSQNLNNVLSLILQSTSTY